MCNFFVDIIVKDDVFDLIVFSIVKDDLSQFGFSIADSNCI